MSIILRKCGQAIASCRQAMNEQLLRAEKGGSKISREVTALQILPYMIPTLKRRFFHPLVTDDPNAVHVLCTLDGKDASSRDLKVARDIIGADQLPR